MKPSPIIARILAVFIWGVLLVLPFEIYVRVSKLDEKLLKPILRFMHHPLPGTPQKSFPYLPEGLYRASADPDIIYELQPNAVVRREKGIYFKINSLGFRDIERSARKPPGTCRIIIEGWSYLFGHTVDNSQTLTTHLEKILNDSFKGKFEVWNGGVSGYQSCQIVRKTKADIEKYDPDLVLVMSGNSGRPHFLMTQDYMALFRKHPKLYFENLIYVPIGDNFIGRFLISHFACYRAAVIAYNSKDKYQVPLDAGVLRRKFEHIKDLQEQNKKIFEYFSKHVRCGIKEEGVLFEELKQKHKLKPGIIILDRTGRQGDDRENMSILDCDELSGDINFVDFLLHPWGDTYKYHAGIIAKKLARRYPGIFVPKPGAAVLISRTTTRYGDWFSDKSEEDIGHAIRAVYKLGQSCGQTKKLFPYFERMAKKYPEMPAWEECFKNMRFQPQENGK